MDLNGETFHGDHGYVQYYIPARAKSYPIILWHGFGQSGMCFESTPDGREGYQGILLRNNYAVYIVDQPRRGRAGATQSPFDANGSMLPESVAWEIFRIGDDDSRYFPNVKFPRGGAEAEQFYRTQTPNTGAEPITEEYRNFMGQNMKALLDKLDGAILVTHSNSGQYGWRTAIAADAGQLKALIAYEPGAYVFPDNDIPREIPSPNALVNERMRPQIISAQEFLKLTEIPIMVVFGDNITPEPVDSFAIDGWRVSYEQAKLFVETINRHGGDAILISLPEIGIRGNAHAAFSDLNNAEVAKQLLDYLHSKKLDKTK